MREIKRAKIRQVGQTKAEVGTWQVTNIPKAVNAREGARLAEMISLEKGTMAGLTLNKQKNSN